MELLPIDGVRGQSRTRVCAIAAATQALARSEERNERRPTLRGDGLPAWQRFKGRLDAIDYIRLQLENAAATQPFAFDLSALVGDGELFSSLPLELASEWVELSGLMESEVEAEEFVTDVARLLKLPTRFGRADLHKVLPHHRVLELPGTGGQLALHLVRRYEDVFLQDSFTIACATWQERLLAGIVAVECGLSGTAPIVLDPTLAVSRDLHDRYDHVVGLTPDSGGLLAANQLALWFPSADIQLI